ncbi:CheR family methyltransferase [Tsukamurella soli]|uniref:protein-glutamate O-methyltransferase n=1 Tax=Tsukamurella soli TaxID=644556 RepID=A0ABP8K2Y0_9ACTN
MEIRDEPEIAPAEADLEVERLLEFLRESRGFDFTGYKRTSLVRRIRKRMSDVGVSRYADYRDLLEADADEFQALFNTVLINVTSFFRDVQAWNVIERDVLPELLAAAGPHDEIRLWSAGCSSGEEPYSLAIALAELLGLEQCLNRVKIYATDIDEEALRQARAATYPARSLDAMDPRLRERYFVPGASGFTFRPDLRRRVIFGRHDITRDAPISRLDLLVCRNTLMYFNAEAQSQILDRYYFALKPRGRLFLGKAEMLLSDSARFDPESIRHRIFVKREGATSAYRPPVRFDADAGHGVMDESRRRQLRDMVLDTSPDAVLVVDTDGTVALVNAQARTQFGLADQDVGRPFRDLEISYRPIELRSLIDQAHHDRVVQRIAGIARDCVADGPAYVDLLVQPLSAPDQRDAGVALIFTDSTVATRLEAEVKRAHEDLETANEELQSTNEELETTNEELQSSVEELETTNEELQSTNEELETTNEELQSGNEELEAMNEELRIRTTELDETRSFLERVLTSIGSGVVVLDAELRVIRWNRGAEELWGIRADEAAGAAFFKLDFGLPTVELRDAVARCLSTGRRVRSVPIQAVDRKGRTIACSVSCAPMDEDSGGVLLMMDEVRDR